MAPIGFPKYQTRGISITLLFKMIPLEAVGTSAAVGSAASKFGIHMSLQRFPLAEFPRGFLAIAEIIFRSRLEDRNRSSIIGPFSDEGQRLRIVVPGLP